MKKVCIVFVLLITACAPNIEKKVEKSKQVCMAAGVAEKDIPNCIVSLIQTDQQKRALLGSAFIMSRPR